MPSKFFPVRSYVFGALLCLLLVKLCYTGVLFYTSLPVSFLSIWDSRPALAGDGQQLGEKASGKAAIPAEGAVSPPVDAKKGPEALEIKRRQLEQKEKALEEEAKRLVTLKEEINAKLLQITELQKAVRNDLGKKEAIRNDRIKHLIKVYQAMPPRKAAVLIEKLDMDVIIALFSEMKGENVGQILPYVSAEKAAKISECLAQLGF